MSVKGPLLLFMTIYPSLFVTKNNTHPQVMLRLCTKSWYQLISDISDRLINSELENIKLTLQLMLFCSFVKPTQNKVYLILSYLRVHATILPKVVFPFWWQQSLPGGREQLLKLMNAPSAEVAMFCVALWLHAWINNGKITFCNSQICLFLDQIL